MKKLLFVLLINIFFVAFQNGNAQGLLSPQAEVSLLTCSPGDEMYSLFGHSAIRVKDPVRNLDLIYNYGTFDFDTPNFTLKFIQGKLLYKVSVEQFRRFEYVYKKLNRQVKEQIFNFTQEEKQKVFDYLANNALPENAEYQYDFFFDNCSSRLLDVLKASLGDDLSFNEPDTKRISYRNHLDFYINDHHYTKSPWADFGMDLILGIPSDQIADFKGETFLPDHLSKNFTYGKLRDSVELVQPESIIVPQEKPASIANWKITPLILFWLLCGITGLLFLVKNNTFTKVFDFILFLILGLSGALFISMWVATDHEVCHQNLNMLWMNPLHILLAINILRNNLDGFWKKYLWFTIIVNVLLLLGWKILPQDFHAASFPIILIIMMRAIALLKNKKTEPTA